MPPTALEIKARLDKAVDPEGNVLNMEVVLEVVSCLERLAMTSEALEVTRIGRTINTMRKKTQNKELAKRAKKLVEKWRAQVLSNNHIRRAFNNDSPTSIVTNGSATVIVPKDKIIDKSIEQREDIKSRKRKKLKSDCSPSNNSVNNSFSCKLNSNTLTINKADCKLKSVSNTALSQVANSNKPESLKPNQTTKIPDSKIQSNSHSNTALSQVTNSKKIVSPKPSQVSKITKMTNPSIEKQLFVKKFESQIENIFVPPPLDTIETLNKIQNISKSDINFNTDSIVESACLNKTQFGSPDKKFNKTKDPSLHHMDITNYHKDIKDVNMCENQRTSEGIMNSFHQNFIDKEIELLNNNIELDKSNLEKHNDSILLESQSMTIEPESLAVFEKHNDSILLESQSMTIEPESLAVFEKHNDSTLLESQSMTIEPESLAVCRKEHPIDIVNPDSLADGVNGVYDKDGVWKSWTDHLYHRNNTLCILPYVVLE